jgi:hypothetical protein
VIDGRLSDERAIEATSRCRRGKRVHRSRLTAIGIDVPGAVQERTARFWAGAFGAANLEDSEDDYRTVGAPRGVEVFVQRLGTGDARIHLDIETDSIDAEVARLETLGAGRVRKVESWWVMRDPAGNLFCVVGPQSDDFPGDAIQWP